MTTESADTRSLRSERCAGLACGPARGVEAREAAAVALDNLDGSCMTMLRGLCKNFDVDQLDAEALEGFDMFSRGDALSS
jgi:hypothetical protein